jgi:Tfp pilus assembly protein PilO
MQIKNRQQLLIIVTVSAVALFAADKLLLTPLSNAWDKRAARITELRKQLATSKAYQARETGLRNHWRDMSRKTLTNETSAAEQQVFQAIDGWAQNTGVTITAITPQWKHDSEDYMTYGCRIDATGDIDRLSRFLYRVEREPMALKLESVELSARDKDGRQLSLGLQVSALVLNPPAK